MDILSNLQQQDKDTDTQGNRIKIFPAFLSEV